MDTLQSRFNLMTQNCFMGSLDLTEAYYSVSISPESQKYMKFQVQGQLYKFVTLPSVCSVLRISNSYETYETSVLCFAN